MFAYERYYFHLSLKLLEIKKMESPCNAKKLNFPKIDIKTKSHKHLMFFHDYTFLT